MPCCWRLMLRASATTDASWCLPTKTTGPLSSHTTGSVPQECVSLTILPHVCGCSKLQTSAHGNPQQRRDAPKSSATSSFLTTLHRGPELLSRAWWRSVHPPLAIYQGGYPSPLCGIWVFTLLLPGFPALDVTKRNLKRVFLQLEMLRSEKLISWLFIPQFVKVFVFF